jgi:hypothetical protein
MKALKTIALAVMALATGLVIVASPAFATPNLTASSGTRTVSPFFTPIGNTRSGLSGLSNDSQITIPTIGTTIICSNSTIRGYVDTTHTQIRITSLSFGDDGGACVLNPRVGTVDNRPDITCTATSANPWLLHVTNVTTTTTSSLTTINMTSTCAIRFTHLGTPYNAILDSNQSCRHNAQADANELTTSIRLLDINCSFTMTLRGGVVRASAASTLSGRYGYLPDTARDALRVTPSS